MRNPRKWESVLDGTYGSGRRACPRLEDAGRSPTLHGNSRQGLTPGHERVTSRQPTMAKHTFDGFFVVCVCDRVFHHNAEYGVSSQHQGCVRMADSDLDLLQTALQRRWSRVPNQKAKPYVHAFSAAERRGTKITAKVVGNHGTYTVSIQVDPQGVTSAWSCYIGKHEYCHHCEA